MNNMRQFRLIIWAMVMVLLTGGCSDFLEGKSQDEVIPSTVTDFREVLLNYQQTAYSEAILALDDDVMIDESYFWSTADNVYAVTIAGTFTWQADMWERSSVLDDSYAELYESIKAMNAILENIDEAEGSTEERETVKAQALGMRAWNYFTLVNTFAQPYNYDKESLGVVLKLQSSYQDDGLTRSSVEEVYDRIVEDLETASLLLNKYPKQRGDYLMNSTASDILLSRVYLYMEEWDKAIEAANRAIETAEGLKDYTELPVGERFYMTLYDNVEVEWLFCRVLIPYPLKASTELMALYEENDRRPEFIPGSYGRDIGKVSTDGWLPNVMVRSAEAYLNRAEARVLSSTPDLSGALADLNELRRHRITGYTDVSITDAETLLEEIRKERRLEFCFEGHRWFDLRRYGMPSISHDFRVNPVEPVLRYTLREKDPLYTLPIPSSVMENNIRLQQNASASEPTRSGQPI